MCVRRIITTSLCALCTVYKCNGLDFISSGLLEKDHTLRKVRTDRSHSRDRDKLHGVKSPAGSEPGKGKGKGPGVKKVPNKSSASASSSAATGKTVTQTKTKGMSDHQTRAQAKKMLYTPSHLLATSPNICQDIREVFFCNKFSFWHSQTDTLASLCRLCIM